MHESLWYAQAPDSPGSGTASGSSGTTGPEDRGSADQAAGDPDYWRAEAKKAFAERDRAKRELRELVGRALTEEEIAEYRRLKAEREQAEEERKRKAGEFDALRQQLLERHQKELAEVQQRAQQAEQRYRQTMIGLAFSRATEWFGPTGQTIYQPAVAQKVFGDYVDLDPETGDVVVMDPQGSRLLDPKTGKPMPFAEAIGELIRSLPDRDYHLRGSGKVGSGSAGGATTTAGPADLDTLIARAKKGDKEAIKALQRRHAELGGLQLGPV